MSPDNVEGTVTNTRIRKAQSAIHIREVPTLTRPLQRAHCQMEEAIQANSFLPFQAPSPVLRANPPAWKDGEIRQESILCLM